MMDEKKDCLFQLRNRPFFARVVIINSQVKDIQRQWSLSYYSPFDEKMGEAIHFPQY